MKIKIMTDLDKVLMNFYISPNDQVVLETDMFDISEWVNNALYNKLRQVKDMIILKDGYLAPRASVEEREQRIDEMIKEKHPLLKSGKQKNKEAEALLEKEDGKIIETNVK